MANLNSIYKGDATGETFRGSGKTDIRIEAEDRAAFVAECKVWKGSKLGKDGIDQLLSYLTWRDCKCALVIFNKHNAKFSELLKKVRTIFQEHPQLNDDLGKQGQGEWRFVFATREDESRRIMLHVILLNMFVN